MVGTLASGLETLGSNGKWPETTQGQHWYFKRLGDWRGRRNHLFKRRNPRLPVIGRFLLDPGSLGLEENQEVHLFPILRSSPSTSAWAHQGSEAGCGGFLCLFHDKCFYFLGDVGFYSLTVGLTRVLWQVLTTGLWEVPSVSALPSAGRPWWPLGLLPTLVLIFLCWIQLVSSPGVGWVWEEDQDSWDSLAGGLLAWSRAQLLSHPCHSLPPPPSS